VKRAAAKVLVFAPRKNKRTELLLKEDVNAAPVGTGTQEREKEKHWILSQKRGKEQERKRN